jgi:LPS-assembly protein
MASHVRAAFVLSCLAASWAHAADICPAPPKYVLTRPADIALDDHHIFIESDFATLSETDAAVGGRVIVRQDSRSVAADSFHYDRDADKITVTGKVDFLDPKLRIRSANGSYATSGSANFDQANFQLMDRNGRGFAKDIDVDPAGKIALTEVRYTSCPVGNDDWFLKASKINLDTKLGAGVARNVVMRFKDVPIFYTPYISFPLGDERKSGVLFPSFGHSGSNGYELEIPYYFNLAPNYDLTLTPGELSARGVQLAETFRFLTANSHGQFDATFLPGDKQRNADRSYFRFADITDIRPGLRLDTDIAAVSDSNYFVDFAVGSDQTSVTYLERRLDLLYYDDAWRIRTQLQNFQTIDTTVPAAAGDDARPYSRVPRIQASALYPIADSNLEFVFDSEAVNFLRKIGPTGVRVNLSPELRWSSRGSGYFFEPAIGYDFTQYDLQDAGFRMPTTPTRALPYARLDTGLVFERDAGSQGQRTQTLEPRLVYSYVPYRNQNQLPIFDTGIPDLNLTELFRTNRYVGSDRIGDANQVALAVTTRLFDHINGTQYLSATIGQIRYFSIPQVGLPLLPGDPGFAAAQPGMNPLAIPGALTTIRGQFVAYPGQYPFYQYPNGLPGQTLASSQTGQGNPAFPASDIVGEVSLTGYRHLSVNLDYQWNPYTSQTEKSEISVQYRPDPGRVVNVGYRFQDGILKQWDGSFAWPIAAHWNTVGRWVYSLLDHQTIEQVAGFEYKSCCYRIQLVQRRYVSNHFGGLDTSIALQLELTGLSSVGKREDSFLERSIRGYSTRDPNTQ